MPWAHMKRFPEDNKWQEYSKGLSVAKQKVSKHPKEKHWPILSSFNTGLLRKGCCCPYSNSPTSIPCSTCQLCYNIISSAV